MYKIKFIPTGHVEKNGKKYKDKIEALKNNNHEKFILSKVLDK